MFIVIYDLDRLLSAPIFSPILILNDEYEDEPVFEFHRYADSLLRIITGSSPRYSIGIYGDWDHGKTTLMKLLQHKLDEYNRGRYPNNMRRKLLMETSNQDLENIYETIMT